MTLPTSSLGTAPQTVGSTLAVEHLTVRYGDAAVAVDDLSLRVEPGEIVALLGANGAGKSSLLNAVSGFVPVLRGSISVGEEVLDGLSSEARARYVAHVPEGRQVFPHHTARENLLLAAYGVDQRERLRRLDLAEQVLPRLRELSARQAGLLSGGEQQMVALGRGLMSDATVLMVDELSLGLAPTVANQFADTLLTLRDSGYAILLVEQYLSLALRVADRVIVLDRGMTVLHGATTELAGQLEAIERAYLGSGDDGLTTAMAELADPGGDGVTPTDAGVAAVAARSLPAEIQPVGPARTNGQHEGRTAPVAPGGQRARPLLGLIGALVTIASMFGPWFDIDVYGSPTRTLDGTALPGAWPAVLIVASAFVAGLAGWRRARRRSLGRWAATLAAGAGLVAVAGVLARTWLLDDGLGSPPGATVGRRWGLLVAIYASALSAAGAMSLLLERLRRSDR